MSYSEKKFNWKEFDDVFSFDLHCAYEEADVQDIQRNRTALEGLFIDKVLKILGIKIPAKYYPPKSHGDLRNLFKAVIDCGKEEHQTVSVLSVLYYILLDFDGSTEQRDYSNAFEKKSFLPEKYQVYMKGLWHLDRLDFQASLQYLTHPSVIPTFPDDILWVLVRHSKHNDLTLPLAYYHAVQPALTDQTPLEYLFSAIARTSIMEAFYFSRGQPEHARKYMFEVLIASALSQTSNTAIEYRSAELINLPFTQQEEKWFEDYLLRGEGRSLQYGKATMIMRKFGTGNFEEASAFKATNSRAIGGLDWSTLLGPVQKGPGPRLDV